MEKIFVTGWPKRDPRRRGEKTRGVGELDPVTPVWAALTTSKTEKLEFYRGAGKLAGMK